jgi:hypothetical protein
MRLRTKTLLMAVGAAAALAFQPIVASAQEQEQNTPCAQRDNIVNTLDAQYKESPRAVGLVSKEAVLEVFVSESGSWTLVVTNPQGLSCVLAAGQSWEEIPISSRLPGA